MNSNLHNCLHTPNPSQEGNYSVDAFSRFVDLPGRCSARPPSLSRAIKRASSFFFFQITKRLTYPVKKYFSLTVYLSVNRERYLTINVKSLNRIKN